MNKGPNEILADDHPCKGCGQCCKHIALEIDEPEDTEDYDNIYWYLVHENIRVYINEDDDWMLEVSTKCKNLTPDLRCGDYENRPALCEEYDPRDCVKTNPDGGEKRAFNNAQEFLDYLKERGKDYDPREEAKRLKREPAEDG